MVTNGEVRLIKSIVRENVATGTSIGQLPQLSGGGGIAQEDGTLIITGALETIQPYNGDYIETRVDTSALNEELPEYFFTNTLDAFNYTSFDSNHSYSAGSQLLITGGTTFVSGTHFFSGRTMNPLVSFPPDRPISEGTVWIGGGSRAYFTKNVFSYNKVLGFGSGAYITNAASNVFFIGNSFFQNSNIGWIEEGNSAVATGVIALNDLKSAEQITILQNSFYRNSLKAGVIQSIDIGSTPVLIGNNFFHENEQRLKLAYVVERNKSTGLIVDPATTNDQFSFTLPVGVSVVMTGDTSSATKIVHNSFYNEKGLSMIYALSIEGVVNPVIAGNLFYSEGAEFAPIACASPSPVAAQIGIFTRDNIEWYGFDPNDSSKPLSTTATCINSVNPAAPPAYKQSVVLALYPMYSLFYHGPNAVIYTKFRTLKYNSMFRSHFASEVKYVDQLNKPRKLIDPSFGVEGNTVGSIELPILPPPVQGN